MLGLRFQSQLFKTCLRRNPRWTAATKALRPVRRYVSTHDLDRYNHAGNSEIVTQVVDGKTGGAGTTQSGDEAGSLKIEVREADGRSRWRAVKRSYPNGKVEGFSRELISLITHPRLPGSDDTAEEGKDTSCDTVDTSPPKTAMPRVNMVQAKLVSDVQSPRWRLSASGQFLIRTICVVKEQYPRFLRAIDKEADVLEHHPHVLGYELEDSYIVNMICTTHQPAGLSRKDTKLAIHINYLIDQLENAIPPTDHAATQIIIERLCDRNMTIATLSAKEPQTDSMPTLIDSHQSNLSLNGRASEEVGLPEQQESPRYPIFSVESTIIPSILGKLRRHLGKPIRVVTTDTTTIVHKRIEKSVKSVRVSRRKARSAEKSMLIRRLLPRSAKTLPIRKLSTSTAKAVLIRKLPQNSTETVPIRRLYLKLADTASIRKLPTKATDNVPMHKTPPKPAAPVLIRKQIAKSPILPKKTPATQNSNVNKSNKSPNHKPPIATTVKIQKIRSKSDFDRKRPEKSTPTASRKVTPSKTATIYHQPRYSKATDPNLNPRRQLKIIRTTLNPSNLIRSTLVTSKDVHITREYTGNEPLTAGDVLRGTRPGSVHEKDLALFWGHLF